ncbi:MAG: LytTR family DNA-binding domain-containing protein [Flavisolibacter sp.]
MLNCIAVDDEPLALDLLEDNIKRVSFLNLVGKCNDGFEAIEFMQDSVIDLVFIDIQMPGLTGLQLIESLPQKPMFILITAYKQFALEGYSLDVVDYLLKPVSMDRFIKACNKANALHELKALNKANQKPGLENDFFFINVDYSLLKIHFSDITWIEGLRDYIKIYFTSKAQPVITRSSISGIEKLLPESKFLRIHKSYILSVHSITAVRKGSVFIGDREFPVGETFKDAVLKLTRKQG